jgi:hypothetical protein
LLILLFQEIAGETECEGKVGIAAMCRNAARDILPAGSFSKEYFVIASEAKQSSFLDAERKLDCFVASAFAR